MNEANKNQFDLKQFGIEGNQNGSSYGTTDLNDYNFKQTTTTTTTTTTTNEKKGTFSRKRFHHVGNTQEEPKVEPKVETKVETKKENTGFRRYRFGTNK